MPLSYNRLKRWQKIALLLVLWDFLSIELAYFLALFVRFDCKLNAIPPQAIHTFRDVTPYFALLAILQAHAIYTRRIAPHCDL